MNYLGSLRLNQEGKQKQVEDILERNKAQPVGHGYIDIITDSRYIRNLVFELTQVGIAINGVTWWCHCTDENRNLYECPHGMGGPQSIHFEGWFSEMGVDYESSDLPDGIYEKLEQGNISPAEINSINESILVYTNQFKEDERFSPCFVPAIWLHVPKEWRRLR